MFTSKVLIFTSALFLCWGALTVGGVFLESSEDFYEIVNIVLDMQEDYKASNIFIIYAGDEESLNTTTLMQRFLREFSRKFVSLLMFNYRKDIQYYAIHKERMYKPLIIVLITSQQDLHSFRTFTAKFDMSYAAWLVIFTETTIDTCYKPLGNLFNLLFDTKMLVKCHGDPIIREWYSLRENETIVSELATWDTENGFKWQKSRSRYRRRNNLEGIGITAVIITDPLTNSTEDEFKLTGFFGSVINEMSNVLNFTLIISPVVSYQVSNNEYSDSYLDALGEIERGDVDMGSTAYVLSPERLEIFEYTVPFTVARGSVFIQQPVDSALHWSAYLKVYSIEAWIKILISLMFSILLMSCAMACHSYYKKKRLQPNYVSENVLEMWSVLCLNGLSVFPKETSTKVVCITVLFEALIIYVIYSTCLISYLTVTTPPLPFSDIEGLANDGTYKLVTIRASPYYDFIKTSNDQTMKKLQQHIPEADDHPSTELEGFEQICKDKKKAFYSTNVIQKRYLQRIQCNIVSITTGRMDSLTFILKKRSGYRGLFNNILLKFQNFGIIHRLNRQMNEKDNAADNQYNPVDIKNVVPVLCVFGFGFTSSIVILFFERIAHKIITARQNRRLSEFYKSIIITKNPNIISNRKY